MGTGYFWCHLLLSREQSELMPEKWGCENHMNKKNILKKYNGLIFINITLAALLLIFYLSPNAKAQLLQRTNVTGVTGSANGANGELLYLINTTNGELVSLSFDINKNDLRVIGFRNLIQDGQSQQGNNR